MVLIVSATSCASTRYVSQRRVTEMDEVSYVLANYYPQLHYYYMEGVLRVNSLKEVVLPDNTVDYKVDYDFVRYYYRNFSDRMDALKEYYPELYQMYVNGVIEITSLYKYVERDTGKIRHRVSYRRIYDYYYHYYPGLHDGVHIYYRPRPRYQPAPPPRPRPDVRPNNPPRQQPNTRPNNPPRQQQNTQPRGNRGGRR